MREERKNTRFVRLGDLRELLAREYMLFGRMLSLAEAINVLVAEGRFIDSVNNTAAIEGCHHLDTDEFIESLMGVYIIESQYNEEARVSDFSAFSQGRADVIAQVLLPYTASSVHRHSSYEVIYVLRGGYMFSFEGDERRISAGDSVIITSGSRHSFSALGEDSFAMRFFISDSAFRNSMSSVMESQDILAEFIKTAVSNIDVPNYLLISTGGSSSVNSVAKHLLLEQFRYDSYSPMCTMNWLRLFFANLMRSCIHYYQHSIGQGRIDFARILGYIDENYKTASLGELSRRFNYSVSYLSETIKTATGRNFSDIIRERKLDDAKKYLEYTGMTVMEISEACGFQSADTFSRSFKNYFDVTPSGYRKALRAGKQT